MRAGGGTGGCGNGNDLLLFEGASSPPCPVRSRNVLARAWPPGVG